MGQNFWFSLPFPLPFLSRERVVFTLPLINFSWRLSRDLRQDAIVSQKLFCHVVVFFVWFQAYNHGLKGLQKPKTYCDNSSLRSYLSPLVFTPLVFTVRSGPVWRQDLAILSPEGPRDNTCQLRNKLFSVNSWWQASFLCRFHVTVTVTVAFFPGNFVCIAVAVLVTAKYSRNLIMGPKREIHFPNYTGHLLHKVFRQDSFV